jgi:hypothetical protein
VPSAVAESNIRPAGLATLSVSHTGDDTNHTVICATASRIELALEPESTSQPRRCELVGVILRIGDDKWLCYGATKFRVDGNRDVATRAVLQAPYRRQRRAACEP